MNEPILTEPQTESDDWEAAMAEQQAAENQATSPATPETSETSETRVTSEAAEVSEPSEIPEASDDEIESVTHTATSEELTKSTPVFEEFSKNEVLNDTYNDIDMILDIPVQLTVELGRTRIAIKSLLQLAQGSVIELNGMAGEPMDVLVNGCLIAQGEVVVVNEKFGIRLTDIITPSERIRKLNR